MANAYDPSSIADILVGQGTSSFKQKDYANAESLFLQAQRPLLVVQLYKEQNMWKDALRFTKDYLPQKLSELIQEYDVAQRSQSTAGNSFESALVPARLFEQTKDYPKAIDAYLNVNASSNHGAISPEDLKTLESCWLKAVELAVKYVSSRAQIVGETVAGRLVEIGHLKRAGTLYSGIELVSIISRQFRDLFLNF